MIPSFCDQGREWNDIKISNDIYMICVVRKNGTFEVSLTNLIEVWLETLTEQNILHKCRKLNPLLNIEAFNYNEVVRNILDNVPKYVTEATVEQINLRANVQGGMMKFSLNLSKGTPQDFWNIVTKPLCLSSMELIRQHKILLDLVKKKDEEIAEYKAEGAELIRKNIETKTFTEDQLKKDFSLLNYTDCTDAFQAVVKFYNALDLQQSHVEQCCETSQKASSCVDDKNASTAQSEESLTVFDTSDNGNDSTHAFVEVETGSSKSEEKDQSKSTSNKKTITNKIKTCNVIYKPSKKLKNSINDFIR